MHHCIHNMFFKYFAPNQIYADIISGAVFVLNRKGYMRDHIGHHRRNIFTTEKDSDAKTLIYLGFKPGMNKRRYYLLLAFSIINPIFHIKFLIARLEGSLKDGNTLTRVTGATSLAAIFLISYFNFEFAFFSILLPLFILYNVSALLQFLTEHLWLTQDAAPSNIDEYAQRCWGRFSGTRRSAGLWGFTRWFFHLILIAIPLRYGCWVSDLPAHDWHHLAKHLDQNPEQWQQSIYLRQDAINEGDKLYLAKREIWGLKNALDLVFDGLANSKISRTTYSPNFGDHKLLLAGM